MGYFDDLIPAQGAPPKPSAMPAGSSPPRKKYPGVIYGTPDPNAGLETRKKTLDVMRSEFDLSDNAEASAIRRTKAAQDSEMHGIQMESERLKLQQLQSDAAKRSGRPMKRRTRRQRQGGRWQTISSGLIGSSKT